MTLSTSEKIDILAKECCEEYSKLNDAAANFLQREGGSQIRRHYEFRNTFAKNCKLSVTL